MATRDLECHDCKMLFKSPHLLTKHKSKFCIGSKGDPYDLLLRRGLRSADSPTRQDSPDFDRVSLDMFSSIVLIRGSILCLP